MKVRDNLRDYFNHRTLLRWSLGWISTGTM